MWTKSYSITTPEVTQQQMFELFADINSWSEWDHDIEYARLDGKFEAGKTFLLKPKKGPEIKIELIEVVPFSRFRDLTRFPFAKMYGLHTFDNTPDGLKITTTMSVEGPLGFLWRKIVAQGIADGLPTEMLNQIEVAKKRRPI